MDAGFANVCGGEAWDTFAPCLSVDASPLDNPFVAFNNPEHDTMMNEVLNLDGLPESGHNFNFNWNLDNPTIPDLPLFDESLDPSQAALYDLPLTGPLFTNIQDPTVM